jgi:hypothetical protein
MSERGLRTSKAPDAAVVLPVFGMFLLLPPVISLFAAPVAIWGIPLIVLYVFGAWAGLIGCAALLARRLDSPPSPQTAEPETSADRPAKC